VKPSVTGEIYIMAIFDNIEDELSGIQLEIPKKQYF
jgi:hypothetical protein